METLTNFIAANSALLIGVAAVLCGVALFSLVMSRTIKRRDGNTETADQ